MYVLIKYRALTVDNQYMPLFLYATPLTILSETDETITVRYNDYDYYTYTFKKKNVDRMF